MDIILSVILRCCSQFALKTLLGSQDEEQNWIQKMIILIIFANELICDTD